MERAYWTYRASWLVEIHVVVKLLSKAVAEKYGSEKFGEEQKEGS